jgi:polyisoprenoid-binding protein YceI
MKTNNGDSLGTEWNIDPMHTTVGFSVRHLMITNVRGVFDQVSGTVRYDADAPERTELRVEIPAASINTRQPQRDAHLRSPEFFDAESHPLVRFQSTAARKADNGSLEVTGNLTMRGVTREIVLTISEISPVLPDHRGVPRVGANATAKVKRSEFGMLYNRVLEAGRLAVGDDVSLSFDVSLEKAGVFPTA